MIPKELYKFLAIALIGAILGALPAGYFAHKMGYSSGYTQGGKDKEAEIAGKITKANEAADARVKKKEDEIKEVADAAKEEKRTLQALYDNLKSRAKDLESKNKYLQSQLNSKGEIIYVEKTLPPVVYTLGYVRLWNDAIRGPNSVSEDRLSTSGGTGSPIQDSGSKTIESGDPRIQVDVGRQDFLDNHIHNQEVCQNYVVSFRRLVEAVKKAQEINEPIKRFTKDPYPGQ